MEFQCLIRVNIDLYVNIDITQRKSGVFTFKLGTIKT